MVAAHQGSEHQGGMSCGTNAGQEPMSAAAAESVFAVRVRAADHNEAVRKGSHAPHMLVVRSVCLIDEGRA
jgi:hypothetical protein